MPLWNLKFWSKLLLSRADESVRCKDKTITINNSSLAKLKALAGNEKPFIHLNASKKIRTVSSILQ